jgi:ATP-dependent Clp protease ATP-binding subunit ClpC
MAQAAQSMETRKTETLQMSTGVRVALQRAAAEAVRSHHEFIQPEHLFNGITKLEDLTTPEALRNLNLPSNITPAFTGEVQRLMELFGRFGIAPRQARRAMRILIGNGGYLRATAAGGKDTEHVSRSPESRAAFDRAPQIAHDAKAPLVGAQHLLAALLDSSDNRVRELLTSLGVDVDALYLAAVTLPVTPLDGAYTPTLNQWGTDMTQLALEGKLPETIGRQEEMLQVIRTLARESKNNPVLIGDAGVGKTAIVEGIAYRIARGEIDPNFHNKRIIQISVADLVASTEYRGQFEERMQTMIAEAEAPNIILFIDEIHMLVGAGLVEHSNMDAANILKPALARGQIKLIGATTEAEYYRYIAKDPAFERRMQPLKVLEPTPEATRTILFGIRDRLQKHHGVTIRDDAIDGAIQLSVRYMPSRRLPDKARDLLDEACTRVRYVNIGSARGAALEDTGNTDQPADDPGRHVGTVTTETIREVIAEKVGVPVARMSEDETHRILQMPQFLRERVVGQDRAGEGVAAAIRRNYADLRSGKRPVGVFLFVGPSGVGKTELAKATANFLFGSDERMIRLDMSEYMEAHSVSRLIGSPPGYTGFEQGGQLTEALRRTPYAVVLLDEVEKAHPDVMNVFLQSFGEGRLTDGQGRTVDASNVIFMMTSNLGTYAPAALGFRPSDSTESAQASAENAVQAAVRRHFRPELINRLDEIVVFQALSQEHMLDIARVHLRPLRESLAPRNISLEVSDEAVAWLARRGHDVQFGARPLIRLIDKQITNEIGGLLLSGRIEPGSTVHVTVEGDELKIATRPTDDATD